MTTKDKLDKIHQDLPSDYFQRGIENHFFLRYWHLHRFRSITEEIRKLAIKGKILDVGCHSGDLTSIIHKETNLPVYGLDISKQAIDYAKSRFPGIKFICNDFPKNSPFAADYFQAVTAFDVLEHIPDLQEALIEIKRLLQPGGYLISGAPSENFLFKAAWFFWLKFRGQVWEGAHVHDFKKEGFGLFEKNGFTQINKKNIIFNMWQINVFRLENKNNS